MKVLHIQKATGIGGAERHLTALLPALRALGVEVEIAVMVGPGGEQFTGALEEVGLHAIEIRSGADASPATVARLGSLLRRFRPDLVHTHLIHADFHGQLAARALRVPAVSSVHGTHGFYRRLPYRPAARLAGHLPGRVIAISHYVERFLLDVGLAPADRVRVVHYGIDAARWDRGPGGGSGEVRPQPGTVVVGVASRLFPDKGHDVLVEAVARARERDDRLHLVVAGTGPLQGEIVAAADRRLGDACTFLGFVDDMPGFMAGCDVVCFPTLPGFGEGFGLAALEAMAAGRPLVASDLDSLPELVVPGRTGVLVPPGDADALAGALLDLAADPGLRTRLGAAARERARTEFTLERMARRTVEVYEESLAGRAEPAASGCGDPT